MSSSMYHNPFSLCHCVRNYCTCTGMHSFVPHYRRLLGLYRPGTVFEWGPGVSSRLALDSGAEVFAIEPSRDWAARLPCDPRLDVRMATEGSRAYFDLHGKHASELFFVDCRRRAECLDIVREQARPDAVVCLHDAQRARYNQALRRFRHVLYLERGFAVASMTELKTELVSEYGPECARRRDRPVGTSSHPPLTRPRGRRPARVAFASIHCLVDFTSGAAISAAECLKLLARSGFECQAFCASKLDAPGEVLLQELLAEQGAGYETRNVRIGPQEARMIFSVLGALGEPRVRSRSDRTTLSDVPVTIFETASTGRGWARGEGEAFLVAYDRFLEKNRPDVVLTYGGDRVARAMMHLTQRRGIPIVFWLRNYAYRSAELFRGVDGVIVPSEFTADHYRRSFALECTAIPSPIDWSRVWCGDESVVGSLRDPTVRSRSDRTTRGYVTFVNPQPTKGVFVFARIAAELGRRRPDIPLLVVEGRGRAADSLGRTGLDLSGLANLHRMANTPDPRDFYRLTRILLVPSLWRETFGRVAAEAMINAIPVLASNRGALPETVGDAGFLFDIPERYTPRTREVPSAAEVEPWVETIIRLWDDPEFYRDASERAIEHARRWHPERLGPLYREFFEAVRPQPLAPILPPQRATA